MASLCNWHTRGSLTLSMPAISRYRSIDLIKDKHAVVQGKLDAYKAANGQKWDNFKGGVEIAWHDLADAFKAIKQ
jgi:hypothetical protein